MNLEEFQIEIFRVYKYALIYIGVDFSRQDVQEALEDCVDGMEEAFQATIGYWTYWKSKNSVKQFFPNETLIKALYDKWKPYKWQPEWLEDPNFQSPCQKWWEEAELYWGRNVRNSLVVDVVENDKGADYILFANGRNLKLSTAKDWGWERVLNYAQIPRIA